MEGRLKYHINLPLLNTDGLIGRLFSATDKEKPERT